MVRFGVWSLIAVVLAGCAGGQQQKPGSWIRADGGAIDHPAARLVFERCRAEATEAAARHSSLPAMDAMAQVPSVDFSPLADIGQQMQQNRAQSQRQQLIESIYVTRMNACMARHGYLYQPPG